MNSWQELVEQALALSTYATEQDIKDALRHRFGSGSTVREKRVSKWLEYLVRQDELAQKNRLVCAWSALWQIALERKVQVHPIRYECPLDVYREKIAGLKKRLQILF